MVPFRIHIPCHLLLLAYLEGAKAWIQSPLVYSRAQRIGHQLAVARTNAVDYMTTQLTDDHAGCGNEEDSSVLARSAFGTKQYWDEVYSGFGDFPCDEYSWYYGFSEIKRHLPSWSLAERRNLQLFVPGVGNDPILLDLLEAGYRNITAQDYSHHAIQRQIDLLEGRSDDGCSVELSHGNVLDLPDSFTNRFDVIIEKGLLDAVYLSGDGQVERAAAGLSKTLRPGGYLISVSGVVPEELRRKIFETVDWVWLRDGSADLKAGCFVLQRL